MVRQGFHIFHRLTENGAKVSFSSQSANLNAHQITVEHWVSRSQNADICSKIKQNKMVHKGLIHVKVASAQTTRVLLLNEKHRGTHTSNKLTLHQCVLALHMQILI